MKIVLRGKFIAMSACIRKSETSKIISTDAHKGLRKTKTSQS
jgi:hypothetical protein